MEQKNNFNQGLTNVWLIVIIALASALVVGSLVFAWQKSAANKEADKLQQQINDLQNQIQQLQQAGNVNDEFADWQTYKNAIMGFEIKYPDNIFQLDTTNATLSHTLKQFHTYSLKDGSDLGLAQNIAITFKTDTSFCDTTAQALSSISVPFSYPNIKGRQYETGAEGEGIVHYCVQNQEGKNIFQIQRWFLHEAYSTDLPKQIDFIPYAEQKKLSDKMLSTFKFIDDDQSLNIEKQLGYIKKVYEQENKRYLDIDYVQYLEGDDAINAMREDGTCPPDIYPDPSYCIPNGFYIRNQNPTIRTFEISKDAEILRKSAFDYSASGEKLISYEEFENLFTTGDSRFKNIPFYIEITDNIIVKITEQFIP